jgi:hypothetical protein
MCSRAYSAPISSESAQEWIPPGKRRERLFLVPAEDKNGWGRRCRESAARHVSGLWKRGRKRGVRPQSEGPVACCNRGPFSPSCEMLVVDDQPYFEAERAWPLRVRASVWLSELVAARLENQRSIPSTHRDPTACAGRSFCPGGVMLLSTSLEKHPRIFGPATRVAYSRGPARWARCELGFRLSFDSSGTRNVVLPASRVKGKKLPATFSTRGPAHVPRPKR